MTRLQWDRAPERRFETGCDRGVLYPSDQAGGYETGVVWNGLVNATEKPSGAEPKKQYADNMVYLTLMSAEEFGMSIEAFTYPDEFERCEGQVSVVPGATLGQQSRIPFGLCYRTRIGDAVNPRRGHKLHLVYSALAAPSEKAYGTVNESPEATTLSWELSTDPNVLEGYDPTAQFTLNSTLLDPAVWAQLEDILYGTGATEPRLPSLEELVSILVSSAPTVVVPVQPTYNATTDTITIPTIAGLEYTINDEVVTGDVVITEDTLVVAHTLSGYVFPQVADIDWLYEV